VAIAVTRIGTTILLTVVSVESSRTPAAKAQIATHPIAYWNQRTAESSLSDHTQKITTSGGIEPATSSMPAVGGGSSRDTMSISAIPYY